MKIQKVKKSWMAKNTHRIDSPFHLSDGVHSKRIIESCPFEKTTLRKESKELYKGNIHSRVYVDSDEHGLPFLTASDMFKADLNSGKYISKKYSPYLKELALKKDWIVITRSGTLGKVLYVNKDFEGKIGTDDLIRINPSENKVKKGYLYAFLKSKYGYALLTQSGYGGVIKHIEPDQVKTINIPVLGEKFQNKIDELINEANHCKTKANEKLRLCTDYFEKKYYQNLKNDKIFSKNINDFNYSWVGRNNDIVAEKYAEQVWKEKFSKISNVASNLFAPSLFKHIYLEKNNGHPFFTGADLRENNRTAYRYLSPRGVSDINKYKISEGTILIYKSGPRDGMLGNVFYADKTLSKACLSDHVIRLIIDDKMLRNWTFAFLKSKIGQRILHNNATGTAVLFITPNRLGEIWIPKPDKKLTTIFESINEYSRLLTLSIKNEQKAINLLETEIDSWQN